MLGSLAGPSKKQLFKTPTVSSFSPTPASSLYMFSPSLSSPLFCPPLQVLCTVTLGPPDDAQKLDSLVGPSQKQFMVHYSFPPFSINEVRPARGGLNRREVGHGTPPLTRFSHPPFPRLWKK